MGFMKPSIPSPPPPVQNLPVKAESVDVEVGEDYLAKERQRQGMISTILSRRNSAGSQAEVNPSTLLRKTLG